MQGMARRHDFNADFCREDVHVWFSLSYANYLILHRSLLQSMPADWQHEFIALLVKLDEAYGHVERPAQYRVQAINESGKFVRDPVPHYERGRTYVEPSVGAGP